MPPSPSSTLFPYTTLFRSCRVGIEIFKSSQDHAFWKRPDQPASQALQPLLRTAKGIRLLGIGVNHQVKLAEQDRKSTRLNSSHTVISYAVFCLKKKNNRSD